LSAVPVNCFNADIATSVALLENYRYVAAEANHGSLGCGKNYATGSPADAEQMPPKIRLARHLIGSLASTTCLAVMLGVSGCDQASLMNKLASSEDATIAQNYINSLRAGKYELIEKDLDASMKPPNVRQVLVGMEAMFPRQEPISVKVVGAQVFDAWVNGKTSSKANFTFEYQFPAKWLLANVATQKQDGGFSIVGFNVTPIADSLENINRFRLGGKGALQYSVLLFAILVPLFILYALIACARTKPLKRKWLWIVFILSGVGQFAVNWTTGEWSLKLVQFQLFGAGAFAPLYGAWTVAASLPVGAVVFLYRRRRLPAAPGGSPS
jgi:hypothetical protein